jgi:hypothetical protein
MHVVYAHCYQFFAAVPSMLLTAAVHVYCSAHCLLLTLLPLLLHYLTLQLAEDCADEAAAFAAVRVVSSLTMAARNTGRRASTGGLTGSAAPQVLYLQKQLTRAKIALLLTRAVGKTWRNTHV